MLFRVVAPLIKKEEELAVGLNYQSDVELRWPHWDRTEILNKFHQGGIFLLFSPSLKRSIRPFCHNFFHTCYFPSRDSSFVLLFRTSIWTRCVFCKTCSMLTSFRSEPGKEGRNPESPLHVPCQGPGRAILYRQLHNESASPKEPFKTRDIAWISGWWSSKPIYFWGLFRQSMLSRIPYNYAVVGKYFFVDALNRNYLYTLLRHRIL